MAEFKIGGVVQLLSGGQSMAVEVANHENPQGRTVVTCVWLDQSGQAMRFDFAPWVLKQAQPVKKAK